MDLFWKSVAAVLLTVVLSLAIGKQEKDFAVLLNMAVCCMAAVFAVAYLEPVFDLLRELESEVNLQGELLGLLLKAAGIGLVAELAGMICRDAGNSSLEKTMQLLGSAAILYLSIPMFQSLLALVRDILGEL